MFRKVPEHFSVAALFGRMAVAVVVLERGSKVASKGVPTWEARVFTRMNGAPDALSPILWLPMQLGSLWGPVALGAAIWRLRGERRSALGVMASGVLAWQLAKVVKNRVGRGRPWVEVEEIAHRGGTPYEGLGYVSGHTAVGAAMATYLGPQLSGFGRVVAWVCVAVIGFGRVHASAHLPLDIVGGAALGVATGDLVSVAQAGIQTGLQAD